jgi:hypothetical protein
MHGPRSHAPDAGPPTRSRQRGPRRGAIRRSHAPRVGEGQCGKPVTRTGHGWLRSSSMFDANARGICKSLECRELSGAVRHGTGSSGTATAPELSDGHCLVGQLSDSHSGAEPLPDAGEERSGGVPALRRRASAGSTSERGHFRCGNRPVDSGTRRGSSRRPRSRFAAATAVAPSISMRARPVGPSPGPGHASRTRDARIRRGRDERSPRCRQLRGPGIGRELRAFGLDGIQAAVKSGARHAQEPRGGGAVSARLTQDVDDFAALTCR